MLRVVLPRTWARLSGLFDQERTLWMPMLLEKRGVDAMHSHMYVGTPRRTCKIVCYAAWWICGGNGHRMCGTCLEQNMPACWIMLQHARGQVTEQISQVRHSSQTLEDLQSSVTSEIRCCLPPSPKLQCWYATVVGALAKFLPATAEFTMKQAGATLDAGGEGGRVQGACDLAGQP